MEKIPIFSFWSNSQYHAPCVFFPAFSMQFASPLAHTLPSTSIQTSYWHLYTFIGCAGFAGLLLLALVWRCNWTQVLVWLLQTLRLPSHVAFIMDGNRRFARNLALDPIHGHYAGFKRLEQVGYSGPSSQKDSPVVFGSRYFYSHCLRFQR